MMLNEDLLEDLKEYIQNLERKIAQLEKDLEKERADKETSRHLRGCKVPHRFLQGQIRPLKQVVFPLQRLFTDETDRKERKSPLVVNPGTQVMQGKNQLQTRLQRVSHWKSARTAADHWANPSMVLNRSEQ